MHNGEHSLIQELVDVAVYLAIGLLVYLLAYGPVDWSDAWVYVIVILWPFVLFWWSLFYIACFVGIVLALLTVAALGTAAWVRIKSKA